MEKASKKRKKLHPRTERLLKELRSWAKRAKHGEHKALADRLGIPPQRLSYWINGHSVPTLGDGLELQDFLKQQQAKEGSSTNAPMP